MNQINNINKHVKNGNGHLGISIDNWAIYTYKFYSSYYIYMYLSTSVSIDMSTLVGLYIEFLITCCPLQLLADWLKWKQCRIWQGNFLYSFPFRDNQIYAMETAVKANAATCNAVSY